MTRPKVSYIQNRDISLVMFGMDNKMCVVAWVSSNHKHDPFPCTLTGT